MTNGKTNTALILLGGALLLGGYYLYSKNQKNKVSDDYSSGVTGEVIDRATQPTIRTDLRQSARTQRVSSRQSGRSDRVSSRQSNKTQRTTARTSVKINRQDEKTKRVKIRQEARTERTRLVLGGVKRVASNIRSRARNIVSRFKRK